MPTSGRNSDNETNLSLEEAVASEARTIELADIADLSALVDEVRRSRRPRILRQDGEDVAVLVPTATPRRSGGKAHHLRPPSAAEVARSRAGIEAAMGSWSDVDTETLKQELRRQRDLVTRPPVEL
jgi:hypothetical protein